MPDQKPVNYYQNVRAEMLGFIPTDSRTVLEVGCGEGYFGQRLKESRQVEVWGIELVEARARAAEDRLDRVLTGPVESVIPQLPASFFDVVIFNDVLEHLVDPFDVLAKIKTCLSLRGVVVSSIPNIRFYPAFYELAVHGDWEYVQEGTLDATHLRFFTGRSIRNMYTRLGYEVVRHEGINKLEPMPGRYRLANAIFRGRFDDMQFVQFATVARPVPAADEGSRGHEPASGAK